MRCTDTVNSVWQHWVFTLGISVSKVSEWNLWIIFYLHMLFIDRVEWVAPLKERPHHIQTTIFSLKAAVCEREDDVSQCLYNMPHFSFVVFICDGICLIIVHYFLKRFIQNKLYTTVPIVILSICIKTSLFAVITGVLNTV